MLASPWLLWNFKEIAELGRACFVMLHYDIFDDEDTEITIAHLSYLFISRGIEIEIGLLKEEKGTPSRFFDITRDRIMLLNEYTDSFTHTTANFLLKDKPKPTKEEKQFALQIANYKLPLLLLYDLLNIELYFKDYQNDSYLIEVGNTIESDYKADRKTIGEAGWIHQNLYKFIYEKVKSDDLNF